ncbi:MULTISPECIES: MinD/ParA family protein [unclassified Thioalkalivibrio]|uniref:MinD/ParA family protein n=1 Tax=unclassified Thioalkalivibrio TaxID=2621013 RepID=UPI00036EEE40|nr:MULTISPECIES: MinD/ParA family protein [unclassified Thioalkalivibrio]
MSDRSSWGNPHSPGVTGPRVLAVASGKGGVGKSSVAVNLGITLARRGRRVCILDGDTGLANVNILLGLRPQRGLAEVLAGECGIEDILLEGPHGLKIIPGASGIRECAELSSAHQKRLVAELARIEQDFDDLLLDTAAGIGDTTLDFMAAGHQVLLVLTPEPTSLTDAFSLLKLALRRQMLKVRVIVNMVADVAEARSVFQRFANAVEKYLHTQVDFLGFIQRDESLRSAVTLQHPVALFPESDPSARPFHRLANALEEDVPQESSASFSRFWRVRFEPDPVADCDPGLAQEAVATAVENPETEPLSSGATSADPECPLDRLHRAFETALEKAEPADLAASLNGLHDRYWTQVGQPAIDVPGVVTGLLARPELHAETLRALREALPEDGLRGVKQDGHRPQANPVPVPSVQETVKRPPDFGWRAEAEGRDDPQRASARRGPGFDCERFGSQEALAERLRRLAGADINLAEFLRRL